MQITKQRKQLWRAIAASLFLHLLVAFSLVGFNTAFAPPPIIEDDQPVELTVVDLSATPAPAPSVNAAYLETDPARETAEEPKEKTFESNANSIGASNVEPQSDAPLPSQEGKERPALDFDNHEATLASQGAPAQPPPQPVAPPATATPPPPAETPQPKPSITPQNTPLPEPSSTPGGEQLAMLTGTPPPPIRDPQETEATPPPESAATPLPAVPRPLPELPASAYQAEKQQTKITGRITNRGTSAVDAVGTPIGRYTKTVSDAIGSRWYYYVKAKSDLASIGTARVAAEVDAQGQIQNLHIISNSANEAFANICLQSFQEAQIPPIPPDLVAAMPGGRMPLEFSFTCY